MRPHTDLDVFSPVVCIVMVASALNLAWESSDTRLQATNQHQLSRLMTRGGWSEVQAIRGTTTCVGHSIPSQCLLVSVCLRLGSCFSDCVLVQGCAETACAPAQ